jgi:hypothetical protein
MNLTILITVSHSFLEKTIGAGPILPINPPTLVPTTTNIRSPPEKAARTKNGVKIYHKKTSLSMRLVALGVYKS